ncbi:hypothetical protein BCR42DRAFT_317006 [Absidia repens]|uniref:DUF155 domain-containing protein n=1 Tax=Absidia repens TaxID=90262 RepID=A0A1X2IY75_9FUNG|nr:hypothetical protein BCR42DRAFT_317006 [Absidia repens]
MKRASAEEGSKKASNTASQSKASAISKQVLKSNPIPQQLVNKKLDATTLLKPKAQPLRSSKVSQKLVLFPQSSTEPEATLAVLPEDHEPIEPSTSTFDASHLQHVGRGLQFGYVNEDEEHQPPTPTANDADFWRPHHATGVALPTEWTFGSRTAAERMPKDERDFAQLPRVAAYCTGEGYNLSRLRSFLREHHHVSPRQYDEALYAAYHFPLMTLRPDKDNLWNIRVRSASPRPSAPRRYSSSDSTHNELEMNYDEDHMDQEGAPLIGSLTSPSRNPYQDYQHDYQHQQYHQQHSHHRERQSYEDDLHDHQHAHEHHHHEEEIRRQEQQQKDEEATHQNPNRKPFTGGEVFMFDYGVVVFWNFRRAEELLMLEDLAEFSVRPFRDNPDEDLQIEEMHFQYDTSQLKPRIFNDMITMKTGNHMIKLTLSHGLSQSAEMAETGRLGKTRAEITKINGQLFNLRMNVNLVSNVLDTPEIFWSEPALQPMYNAIREYLEIPQRAKILNDRLRVISDLLSMLRDHLTNFGVEYQTLIIIYLIIIAVIVACFEIAVKILQSIKL